MVESVCFGRKPLLLMATELSKTSGSAGETTDLAGQNAFGFLVSVGRDRTLRLWDAWKVCFLNVRALKPSYACLTGGVSTCFS